METINLSLFAENPDNPQTVTAEDFALLVESVRKLPHTLAAAKIAYVTDYVALDGTDLRGQRVVIAGNKRLRALKQLAQDHATSADGQIAFDAPLPAEWFYDLTPLGLEARKAWLVKSNIQSGEWDAEKLLALYPQEDLADLMGDDAIAELLREVDTGAVGQNVSPLDDGKAGDTKLDEIVATFGSVKVPMTPKELELITAKYYAYVNENQVGYGFILSLMEVPRNG